MNLLVSLSRIYPEEIIESTLVRVEQELQTKTQSEHALQVLLGLAQSSTLTKNCLQILFESNFTKVNIESIRSILQHCPEEAIEAIQGLLVSSLSDLLMKCLNESTEDEVIEVAGQCLSYGLRLLTATRQNMLYTSFFKVFDSQHMHHVRLLSYVVGASRPTVHIFEPEMLSDLVNLLLTTEGEHAAQTLASLVNKVSAGNFLCEKCCMFIFRSRQNFY